MVALEADPGTLFTPSSAATGGTWRIAHTLYSQLVELDMNFKPMPALATSWDVSSDGLTYTFTLHDGVKWSDGQPLTADDVVNTFQLIMGNRGSAIVKNMDTVSAPTATTFVLTLKKAYPDLLQQLGDPNQAFFIYPKHILGTDPTQDFSASSLNDTPVTSGPFRFESWSKGDQVTVVRNPDFYEAGKPYLDSIVFKVTPDPAARKVAFENGELDFIYSYMIPFEEYGRYKDDSRFQFVEGGLGVGTADFLLFNTRNQYLAHKEVRQAIAYALDRQDYIDKANFGAGKIAHSLIASSIVPYFKGDYDVYSLDVDKANGLLDSVGLTRAGDGTRFSLTLRARQDRAYEARGAEIIKSRLADLGIVVNILPGDAASVYDQVYNKFDFDMVIQLKTTGPDPGAGGVNIMVGSEFIGVVTGNGGGYVNPIVDDLLAQDAAATTLEQRQAAWDGIQKIAMDDLPWLPLFEYPNLQLVSSAFKDTITGAMDYEGSFMNAYRVSN